MSVPQVHQALEQLRDLRHRIIERQLFRGYSGIARVIGGWIALLGGFLMSLPFYPRTVNGFLYGWGTVCALALSINLGAVLYWHYRKTQPRLEELRPVLDAIAPLTAGAVLTFALMQAQAHVLLSGMWMTLFGLVNISSRHALPRAVWHVGWFYIASGIFMFFVWPPEMFLNPWPMAVVFFVGECAGGFIFMRYSNAVKLEE